MKLQNEPNFLAFSPKTKDIQKNEPKSVAQSPSAVVIYFDPKGRPYSGSWIQTSGSFKKQNEPNFFILIGVICEICGFDHLDIRGLIP